MKKVWVWICSQIIGRSAFPAFPPKAWIKLQTGRSSDLLNVNNLPVPAGINRTETVA